MRNTVFGRGVGHWIKPHPLVHKNDGATLLEIGHRQQAGSSARLLRYVNTS